MADTAAAVMTRNVISVRPDAGIAEVAGTLAKHGISAAPVVDESGILLGIISEGDLLRPFSGKAQARRAWWLEMLAEGERLAPEFLDYISMDRHTAADLMTRKPITAHESTRLSDVADLLITHHIKRVPILRGETLVGIVSRADLVRAFANIRNLQLPQSS
jgi:CBS domain-containing protein